MGYFTDSPLEEMMSNREADDREQARHTPIITPEHPCYGCGNQGQVCVGVCNRELRMHLKHKKPKQP